MEVDSIPLIKNQKSWLNFHFSKKIFLLVLFIFLLFIAGAVIFKLNSPIEKIYSTVLFSSSKAQMLSLPAKLTGKGIPNTKVILYLTPNIIKQELDVDQQGNWSYTIPHTTKPGKYRLTIEILDGVGNLVSIKSYKIEIKSSSLFSLTLSSIALAQEEADCSNQDSEEFINWSNQMKQFGIYPVCEDDQLILYDEEAWDKKYCPGRCEKLKPAQSVFQQLSDYVGSKHATHKDVLTLFHILLCRKGYKPEKALKPYLPEMSSFQYRQKFGFPEEVERCRGTKDSIDEQTIIQVFNQANSLAFDYLTEGGDTGLVMQLVGIKGMFNVLTKTKNELTDRDYFDTILFLTILAGPGQKLLGVGGREGVEGISYATSQIAENAPKVISHIKQVRKAIKGNPNGIPFKVARETSQEVAAGKSLAEIKEIVQVDMPAIAGKPAVWKRGHASFTGESNQIDNLRDLPVYQDPNYDLLARVPYADFVINSSIYPHGSLEYIYFEYMVKSAAYVNKASLAHPDQIIYPAVKNVVDAVTRYYRLQMRTELPLDVFNHVYKVRIYVIDDNLFDVGYTIVRTKLGQEVGRIPPAFNINNLIIMKRSEFEGEYGLELLYHEIVHSLKQSNISAFYGAGGDINSLLQLLYEIGTDAWVDVIYGRPVLPNFGYLSKAYLYSNEQVTQHLGSFFSDRLVSFTNPLTGEVIHTSRLQLLLDFARTGDKDTFLGILTGKVGVEGEAALLEQIRLGSRGLFDFKKLNLSLIPTIEVLLNKNLVVNVSIQNVTGNSVPGEALITQILISQIGLPVDVGGYNIWWILKPESDTDFSPESLKQAQLLESDRICKDTCNVLLPKDLQPGKYHLVVYITQEGVDKILAFDKQAITIQLPSKKITKISIQDKELDLTNPVFIPSLDGLKGQPKSFNIPIIVQYNYGEPKYLALTINYQPKITATPLPETTTEPEPTEEPLATPECKEEARDLGGGVARNYSVCNDGSEQPSGEEYCINGSDDPGCRLNQ